MSVSKIFKIAVRASVVESLFRKVAGEISTICNFVKNSNISINTSTLLDGAAGLESTVYKVTKKKPLAKFLKGTFKLPENFQKVIPYRVSI